VVAPDRVAPHLGGFLARLAPSTAFVLSWTSARPPTQQQLQQALQALPPLAHRRSLGLRMPSSTWSLRGLQGPLLEALQQLQQLRGLEVLLHGPVSARTMAPLQDPATAALLVAALDSLTSLQRLSLQGAPLSAQHLPRLAALQQLQQLEFGADAPTQAALDSLSGLRCLQRLSLTLALNGAAAPAAAAGAAPRPLQLLVPELPHLTSLVVGCCARPGPGPPLQLALSERQCSQLHELEAEVQLLLPRGLPQLCALRRLHLHRCSHDLSLPPAPELLELLGYSCGGGGGACAAEQALAQAPRLQVGAGAAGRGGGGRPCASGWQWRLAVPDVLSGAAFRLEVGRAGPGPLLPQLPPRALPPVTRSRCRRRCCRRLICMSR
jgi:hypothetical protein